MALHFPNIPEFQFPFGSLEAGVLPTTLPLPLVLSGMTSASPDSIRIISSMTDATVQIPKGSDRSAECSSKSASNKKRITGRCGRNERTHMLPKKGSGKTKGGSVRHRCEKLNPKTGKPCKLDFTRSYDLTRHEGTIHNGGEKLRCYQCIGDVRWWAGFSRQDALTRHIRICHEFSM
jgi:26S proteasome regulatory subunit N4